MWLANGLTGIRNKVNQGGPRNQRQTERKRD